MPTDIHLFTPISLSFAFADGSINKPTKVPDLKLPCRTVFPEFFGAFRGLPAYFFSFIFQSLPGDQEKELPLNMHGYGPRALLITADRL
jgi:hypothetical protein